MVRPFADHNVSRHASAEPDVTTAIKHKSNSAHATGRVKQMARASTAQRAAAHDSGSDEGNDSGIARVKREKHAARANGRANGRVNGSAREDPDGEDEDGDEEDNRPHVETDRHEGDDNPSSSSEEEIDEDSLTPRQRLDRQRQIKAMYRKLGYVAMEQQSNVNDVSVDDIRTTLNTANKLFKKIKTTNEAVLDSRVLMAASSAAALKARSLKIDANAFDTVEFLNSVVRLMGSSAGRGPDGANRRQADQHSNWGRIGRVLAGESRRPPACDYMNGPLEVQVKAKKARTQRARQKVNENERVRPEELKAGDVEKDKNETGRLVKALASVLEEQGQSGVPYLKFVVNPHSFAQTVENVFYFSFLVRENRACVELEENEESPYHDDYICYSVEPPDDTDIQARQNKTQLVFEVTHQLWRDAIELYDIQEPVIPHREGFQGPAAGKKWA